MLPMFKQINLFYSIPIYNDGKYLLQNVRQNHCTRCLISIVLDRHIQIPISKHTMAYQACKRDRNKNISYGHHWSIRHLSELHNTYNLDKEPLDVDSQQLFDREPGFN